MERSTIERAIKAELDTRTEEEEEEEEENKGRKQDVKQGSRTSRDIKV